MSAAYVSLVRESPLQNVPSTPKLATECYQLDASPLAVVPEFVSQRSTPAPSPFVNFSRCECLLLLGLAVFEAYVNWRC